MASEAIKRSQLVFVCLVLITNAVLLLSVKCGFPDNDPVPGTGEDIASGID